MRLVLDTNVLIAALISRGACAELLEHCALHHAIVASEVISRVAATECSRGFQPTESEDPQKNTLPLPLGEGRGEGASRQRFAARQAAFCVTDSPSDGPPFGPGHSWPFPFY